MSNQAKRTFKGLIEQLGDAKAGALLYALVIILLRNTADAIQGTLDLLVGTPAGPGGVPPAVLGVDEKWGIAKTARGIAVKAYYAALKAGRKQAQTCINSLKPVLGTQWNNLWNEAGFRDGSLAIDFNPHTMLVRLGNYYASNPTREATGVNGVDCTAAACRAAAQAIQDTQAAKIAAKTAADLAKDELDMGMNAGRNRLIGLRNELSQILADDDRRWQDYGFQMPAFMSSPGVPEDFTCVNAGTGTLNFRWANTARADSWRIILKDAAGTVLVDAIVWENEYIATELTSGSPVSAEVSARNITGKSQFTAPVTATVP